MQSRFSYAACDARPMYGYLAHSHSIASLWSIRWSNRRGGVASAG